MIRPDSIKEFYLILKETNFAIQRLDIEIEIMEKLKKGEVPIPPEKSTDSENICLLAEPVIKTVEVNE